MTVVVDASNGTAGIAAPEIMEALGMRVVQLFCRPDGDFPNHQADTTDKANFAALMKAVKDSRADIGFLFDGDADRVSVVDDAGRMVLDNHVFALLIKHGLAGAPGSKIVYEISCSRIVEEITVQSGGMPLLCRVGHTYIHEKMKNGNALLGGETSGHYFFREMQFSDDAIFAALKLLEMLDRSGSRISEIVDRLPKYPYSIVKIKSENRFQMIEGLKGKFRSMGLKFIEMDGVKVIFEDGWLLARPSNTEPIIRIAWEGNDRDAFERIRRFISENIAGV
jgi:phosphomannomutase/phosphoglucomutase